MKKSKIFLICCISFIIGIAVASFSPIQLIQNRILWFICFVVCIVALILFWKSQKFRLIAFIGLFLFLAIWRYSISLPQNTPNKIWYYNNNFIEFVGIINNEPDIRIQNQKLEINVQEIKAPNEKLKLAVRGKILVTTKLYPTYNYGDKLKIMCQLQAPVVFNSFAYDRYLARHDIFSVCYYPKIELLSHHNGNIIYESLFKIKNKLRKIINYGLKEPEASLASAIILGDKRGISEEMRNKFSQIGISHVVAISGMHISILSAIFMGILLALGVRRNFSFYAAIIFLFSYILLIGMPASAMRAGIMGFLVLWALHLGRFNKITNSLAISAVILLLINPRLLRDDIGFQLSFLAVLGIVLYYPVFEKFSKKIISNIKISSKLLFPIFSIFNITMAAQIFLLPIIAINFSQISIISPISNLLILWTLPVIMVSILIAIITGFALPYFAPLFFAPTLFLLKYIIITTELIGKIPFAYAQINYLPFGYILAYYLMVIAILIKKKKKNNKQ